MKITYISNKNICMGGICKKREVEAVVRYDETVCYEHCTTLFYYLSNREFKKFVKIRGVKA